MFHRIRILMMKISDDLFLQYLYDFKDDDCKINRGDYILIINNVTEEL